MAGTAAGRRALPCSGRPGCAPNWSAGGDLGFLLALDAPSSTPIARLGSLDDLMARDTQRESDGFPRKIRIGKLVKPGKGGRNKVVVVPDHGRREAGPRPAASRKRATAARWAAAGPARRARSSASSRCAPRTATAAAPARARARGSSHELEANAYDLGRILTEQFKLPNLKDKGKRRSLTRYNYDLTDRHRGFGQLLDKKATLRRIVETNIALGRLVPGEDPDTDEFMVAPRDKVYRILSPREGLRIAGDGLLPARLFRLDERQADRGGRQPARHDLQLASVPVRRPGRRRGSCCTTPRRRKSTTSTPTTTAAWPAGPRSPRRSSW